MSTENGFSQYRRSQIAEIRPYQEGENLAETVSISAVDKEAGSPKPGDMIARNPANHNDQWLVSDAYFAANFEALTKDYDEPNSAQCPNCGYVVTFDQKISV